MESSVSIQYQDTQTEVSRENIWVTIEQEPVLAQDDMADLATAAGMLQSITQSNSAIAQLYRDCTSARVDGDDVVISINFYVWPSKISLPYGVTSNIGIVKDKSPITQHRSFDVIFDGQNQVELPYIFTGSLAPLMPIYTPSGELSRATIKIADTEVIASEAIHTVYRANGVAKGFAHTVEMRFSKLSAGVDQRITNVSCEISVTFNNDVGETEVEILAIKIPKCALDLLEWCEDDKSIGSTVCIGRDCDEEPILVVYYSTCEDNVIIKVEEELNR